MAHLNIPSIVLSQHERENTHSLAKKKNGFIPLGLDKGAKTERRVLLELKKLVGDMNFRRTCFDRMKPLRFAKNKKKVVKMILNLLDSPF